jgi:hypothetical protein
MPHLTEKKVPLENEQLDLIRVVITFQKSSFFFGLPSALAKAAT